MTQIYTHRDRECHQHTHGRCSGNRQTHREKTKSSAKDDKKTDMWLLSLSFFFVSIYNYHHRKREEKIDFCALEKQKIENVYSQSLIEIHDVSVDFFVY